MRMIRKKISALAVYLPEVFSEGKGKRNYGDEMRWSERQVKIDGQVDR